MMMRVVCARESDVGDSTMAAGRPSDRAERRPSYAGMSTFCLVDCPAFVSFGSVFGLCSL